MPHQADGDHFDVLNNQGRDRDYQVCQLISLKKVLNTHLSLTAKSLRADIDVVTRYPTIPPKGTWRSSTTFRSRGKYSARGRGAANQVIEEIWIGT